MKRSEPSYLGYYFISKSNHKSLVYISFKRFLFIFIAGFKFDSMTVK